MSTLDAMLTSIHGPNPKTLDFHMKPASRSTGQLVMSWWDLDAWPLRRLPILGTCPSISFNRPHPSSLSILFPNFLSFSNLSPISYPTYPSSCLANSSSVVTSRCTFWSTPVPRNSSLDCPSISKAKVQQLARTCN